jgi:hypothetical protein
MGTPPPRPTATTTRNHKLQKLSLSRFEGNILKWQGFYDDFKSAIDSNDTISAVEKFQYWRGQVSGEAAKAIEGLPLTEGNYEHAIALLLERYGQPHKVINAYMKALWELQNPSETIQGLRSFHDNLETHLRGLTSLGKPEDMYILN